MFWMVAFLLAPVPARVSSPRSEIFLAESRWQRFELDSLNPHPECDSSAPKPEPADGRGGKTQPKRCFHSLLFRD